MEDRLIYLLDRQDILDVVTRYCRGVDRFDKELALSAFHEDAMIDQSVFVGGPEEFWDFARNMHGTYHDMTQHYVANHVCDITGDVAHAETYFFYAALNKQGAPFSLMGGRYVDKLEKRGGRWAISERNMFGEWAAPAVNTVEGSKTPEGGPNRLNLRAWQFEAMTGKAAPARDRSDLSYMRPLRIPRERKSHYDEVKARAPDVG